MSSKVAAAVFEGVGRPIFFCDFPVPQPRAGEILAEVTACTLCGSDLHSIHGRRAVPVPSILGHEILGRILAFGPGAPRVDFRGQPLEPGCRITWAIVANCGRCFYCLRNLPQKCERQIKYGHEPLRAGYELSGGLAGACLLAPGTAIFRVDDRLSDAVVCPANCATATVAAAMEEAGELGGRSVLVMGTGMLGVTAIAWARSLGAEPVIGCDIDGGRLALAESFGAAPLVSPCEVTGAVRQITAGHGVDVVFELTGSADAFETSLPLLRMGGRLILVGAVFPSRGVPVHLEQIVRRCLRLQGVHNYAPRHLQAALDFLLAQLQLPWESLVAKWIDLAELDQPHALEPPPNSLRIGVRP